MAFDPTSEIRSILGEVGDPVTLWDGRVVNGSHSVATAEDALAGDMVLAGRTKVLRFATADVAGLEETKTLTWGGKVYKVTLVQLAARGALTRAFLGAP